MSPSKAPESPLTACTQFFASGNRFVQWRIRTRHSRVSHFNPFHGGPVISGSPGSLIRYDLLSCSPPCGPDGASPAQPTKAFTSELSAESVALLAVGYIYGGIWASPPPGLSPVRTTTSFAAPPHTYMDRSRAQDRFWSPMSDDPVAVIYSASLSGVSRFFPGP